jgi:GDP-L-fucose synthase
MPCNLYGINDNFSPENSHVLPALMRKFHEAKANNLPTVTVWGSGKPLREFLNVDDLADACLYLMDNYSGNDFFNVGYGEEVTILELANLVKKVVGYEGDIVMDSSKPDGTMRKLTDISRIKATGWAPKISLEEGLKQTYEWYKANKAESN